MVFLGKNVEIHATPELAQLSAWARASTPPDAVFLFPDVAHGLDPGIFRAEALRAVYVDWKSGGQANFYAAMARESRCAPTLRLTL